MIHLKRFAIGLLVIVFGGALLGILGFFAELIRPAPFGALIALIFAGVIIYVLGEATMELLSKKD